MNKTASRILAGSFLILTLLLAGWAPGQSKELASSAHPGDYRKARLVAQYGGQGQAIAIDVAGQYAYFGSGSVLTIADIHTTPGQFGTSWKSAPLRGLIHGIAVSGSYAYVAADIAGLIVLDISNPASVREVGVYTSLTGPNAGAIRVVGSTAYVADSWNGMFILNISDPTHPQLINQFKVDTSGVDSFAVVGNTLFATQEDSVIYVYNIANPASIPAPGQINLSTYAYSMAAANNILYVGENSGVLQAFDISNLSNITQTHLADYSNNAPIDGLTVWNGILYMADNFGGLCRAYLNDLDQPMCTPPPTDFNQAVQVAVGNGRVFATFASGVQICTVETLIPCGTAYRFKPDFVYSSAYYGGKLYTLFNSYLSVDDPASPQFNIAYTDPQQRESTQIAVYYSSSNQHTYAVLAAGYAALNFVDVTNPAQIGSPVYSMTLLDSSGNTVFPRKLKIEGSYLYVSGVTYATTGYYLFAINLATPTAPSIATRLTLDGEPNDFDTASWLVRVGFPPIFETRTYIYLALSGKGIEIYNATTPGSGLSFVKTVSTSPSSPYAVLAGPAQILIGPSVLYAAVGSQLQVYNISEGSLQTALAARSNTIHAMILHSGFLITADSDAGAGLYDLTDPASPVLSGYAGVPGMTNNLVAGDTNALYIPGRSAGVQFVRLLPFDLYLPGVRK
jgi:hypothetical protein